MLTEQFIASVGVPTKAPAAGSVKDAGIFIQEYQPLNAQRAVLKKSATPPNCLAVNSRHIFAAQAGKAVVHVYGREKSNLEATVPFTDRITSITLACEDAVLVLGTTEGRIFLWELATGRQVTTSPAHLQDVTVVRTDPTSNFLLSASADSTVHVWSIPHLLSFSNSGLDLPSPLRTFAAHKSKINALELGHSSSFCNFAVSASQDRTCLVWDYHTTSVLRTFLLSFVPLSLALDPADRAIYVGQLDGSVQQLNLIRGSSGERATFLAVQDGAKANAPIQPPTKSRWSVPSTSDDAALCLGVSFDGSHLISGHESGALRQWDIGRSGSPTELLQAPLPAAVTNLFFLPVYGLLHQADERVRVSVVTKPKFGAFDASNGSIPDNYSIYAEFPSKLSTGKSSKFEKALYTASFPTKLLDEGLNELLSWRKLAKHDEVEPGEEPDEFMALDNSDVVPTQLASEEQNASLKAELEALRRLQRASFEKIDKLNAEKKALLQREQKRALNIDQRGDANINGIDRRSED